MGDEVHDSMRNRHALDDRPEESFDESLDHVLSGQASGRARARGRQVLVALTVILVVAVVVAGYFVFDEIRSGDAPRTLAEREVAKLNEQITQDPSNAILYFQLTEVYYRAGEYEEALTTLDQIRSLDVTGYPLAQVLFGQAKIEQARGNPDTALDGYLESLEVWDLAEARYALGMLYSELGRWDEAVPHLERYCEMDRQDAGARARLGAAYENVGETDKALAAYQDAARFLPDDPEIAEAIARLGGE